jgi:site-specific DNA-methyltransferase (adenine-specific)
MKSKPISIKYNGNDILLEQEDCIKFLKKLDTGSVDVIVTDPAYSGMNNRLKLGRGRIVGKYADKGAENGKWFSEFHDTEENYEKFLLECKRVLNVKTGHIYIMFDSFSLLSLGHLVRNYFDVKNLITWDKVNLGMGHYFRRRHEFILFATSGNTRKIKNRSFPDVWRFKRIANAGYPTQKPVEVFQTMLFASTEPGYTVCDPFVGSGSSAIAAIKNKCNFFGCDSAKKAIDVTVKRVNCFIDEGVDILQKKPQSLDNESPFWE